MKLNNRGVFLTLMVFLVAIVAVSLSVSNRNLEKQREVFTAEQTALQNVNVQFEKAFYDFKNLSATGRAAKYQSRLLPFDYNFNSDRNVFSVSQKLPASAGRFDNFYNFLNLYSIFWHSTRIQNDLNADFRFNELQNTEWLGDGGDYPVLRYTVLPACMVLVQDYSNDGIQKKLRFKQGDALDNCVFAPGQIQKIKISVTGTQPIGLGEFECTGSLLNGNTCHLQEFASGNLLSFVEFEYFNPNSEVPVKIISGFVDAAESTIGFVPEGGSASTLVHVNSTSDVVLIDLQGQSASNTFSVKTVFEFKEPVQSVELGGFDFSVENGIFGIIKSTN